MTEKIIVITGASAGIGAAAAERLARDGHSLVLVARREEALRAVAARSAGRAHAVAADMTSRDEVRRVVSETLTRVGRIDVWINNVGRGLTRAPSDLTDDDVDEMMRANVKPALYGMQEVLPHFKSRNDGQVVNISSMLGRMPLATFRSAYCGAKHYLNALTITFRDEVRQTHPGIQFTLISPGIVRTEFGVNALHGGPDSRSLPGSQSAEEIAEVIAAAITSRDPDLYTRQGAREAVIGYYSKMGSDPDV